MLGRRDGGVDVPSARSTAAAAAEGAVFSRSNGGTGFRPVVLDLARDTEPEGFGSRVGDISRDSDGDLAAGFGA